MRKAALVLLVLCTAALCAGCPFRRAPAVRADRTVETDVVVVGGGAAGLAAAIEAADNGAKVILVEKTAALGGTTLRAGGGIDAAESPVQKQQNVNYPASQYEEDVFRYGEEKANRELTAVLARNSASAIEWLMSLGMPLVLADPARYPSRHRVPEGSFGVELIKLLASVAADKGVDVRTEERATEIIQDQKGAVTGVKTTGKDGKTTYFKAKATVIATGGFGADANLIERFAKDWAGIRTNLVAPSSTGDGIRMAEAIGADLTHMQYIQGFPTVTEKGATLRGLEPAGAILVNRSGERFVNETAKGVTVAAAMLRQEGKTAFLVMDGKFANQAAVNTARDQGVLLEAEALDELAGKMNVDAAKLKAAVDEYNRGQKTGNDRFGRSTFPVRLEDAPWLAVQVFPAAYSTLGGLRVNQDAQVLKNARPISGLFAAGEVVGGIFGADKFGVSTTTAAIVFGRLAGRNAARAK